MNMRRIESRDNMPGGGMKVSPSKAKLWYRRVLVTGIKETSRGISKGP